MGWLARPATASYGSREAGGARRRTSPVEISVGDMKHNHRRCEGRTRNIIPPVVGPPSEHFLRVHSLTCLAQAHGWSERHGFEVGMQMFAAGVQPTEAAALFKQCDTWTQ